MNAPDDLHLLPIGNHRKPCPQCDKGPRDTALGIAIDADGSIVWNCFRCGFAGAQHAARQTITRHATAPAKAMPQPIRHEVLSGEWETFWRGCHALRKSIAEIYLRTRCCVIPPSDADLRFCPRAYHWPTKTYHPAMVGLITDFVNASIKRSLHFTFLRADGTDKAGIAPTKLLLHRHQKMGGVIRLWPDDALTHGLALAEGIESALSAAHVFTPAWATIDAGNMASLSIIAGIESLTIFADHDAAGLAAAHELAGRWQIAGRKTCVLIPREPGADANDAVQAVA